MSDNNFKGLVKKRSDWVRSSKENNFDFDSILSGLYNDPSHFIYEILQNAEDAGASSICFNLSKDNLEITHNSKNDFDFGDVDGITGIGISTKKDDLNKIGKFGVGFKSVFAITQSPIIESGQYHFQIDDFVLPKSLSLNGSAGTTVKLPFNHPIREQNEIFELVENKLQDIGLKTLLFLSNIKEIKWNSPTQNGHYYKSVKPIKGAKNAEKVEIVSQIGNDENFEEYLVLSKPIKVSGKNLKVEIAFRIEVDENGNENIVPIPVQESKLVVYFPTEKITYLNFIIQGPLKTTPNRENIPLDDEQNELIIYEIANLVADSLPIIKKLKYLSTSFLEVLPIDDENCDEPIYSSIFENVKDKFMSNEKLLPTSHGGYAHPQDSILARGKVLTKLLKSKDIKLLFEKSHWLDTNITFDRTRELRDYLINELEIDEINFEDFSDCITEAFMKSKKDEWVIDYYGELIDRDALFRERTNWRTEGVLRDKPIIRLKNNRHCSPFDSLGKIQVYLPTKTKSSYKTVKSSIANNKTSLEFLKNLNISNPDIFAEINELILPKYANDEIEFDDNEYLEDLEKLISAFSKKKSIEKRNELIDALRNIPIIDSVNPATGENYLNQPTEVYFNTDDLRNYFDGFDSALFINKDLYKKFGQKVFEEFALKIGCNKIPRRIKIEAGLSWEEKNRLRKNGGCSYERFTRDYTIEGLENILQDVDLAKSTLIFRYLLESLADYNGWNKNYFFKGKYGWFYYSEQSEYFDSFFNKLLCNAKWLLDRKENLVTPSEISISELAKEYDKTFNDIEVIEKELGFQLDKIKQIEEETGGKFIPPEEVDDYKRWKAEQNIDSQDDEESDEENWEPDVLPDEVEISISEGIIETVESEDLSYQTSNSGSNTNNDENSNEDDDVDDNDGIPKNQIGDWGEKFVFRYFLENKYSDLSDIKDTELGFSGKNSLNNKIEVKWLNRNREIGKGYDFVIIENGVEVEYIEVKTTIKSDRTLHKITGTQWEFARRLFNSDEGEKYKIYAVKNANSHDAKIKAISNPIKLWKEGDLYAHPINFRV
jgi:hypothetical protein|tara:strand:+ start:2009 stop:5170 length:3162 start_codon:yes stop_codon:yes gene_type:complete